MNTGQDRPDQSFGKTRRLLTADAFNAVFSAPQIKSAHPQAVLLARPSNQPCSRMGLVVAKKKIRLACDRNRFKRIAREAFRCHFPVHLPVDVVVIARPGAGEMDTAALHKMFGKLWRKLQKRVEQHLREAGPA